MNMFYDTVLFDLDGTLHDRDKSVICFIDLFIDKYSHSMDYVNSLRAKEIFTEADCKGYTPREEMFTELLNKFVWRAKPEIRELIDF